MITHSHPVPIKGTGIPSSQGECTIDLGEQGIDPCHHLEACLGKLFPLILVASDLTFCFSQQTLSRESPGPCPWHPALDTHLRSLEQILLPCCPKSSFRTGFFPCLLGKDKLCWFSFEGVPLSSVHVLFFLCLASCRRAFNELFLICGRQWNSEGCWCMAGCRNHSFALAAIHLPYQCLLTQMTSLLRFVKVITKSKSWKIRVPD